MESTLYSAAYFCLIAYAAIGCAHLYASFNKKPVMRRRTKVWLMPLLLGFFVGISLSRGQWGAVQWLFSAALLLYWAGDVLLTKTATGGKFLVMGGICFGLGHFCVIAVCLLLTDFSVYPGRWHLPVLAGAILLYCVIVALSMRHLRRFLAKKMKVPTGVYLGVNALMNCAVALYAISAVSLSGFHMWLGAALFLTSDAILMSVRFNEACFFKTHGWVMLTYLFGTLLITLGVLGA